MATGENIEINPQTVGANFKFLVVIGTRWVRLKESLGYVTIPKFIAATAGIRIIEDKQVAVTALKAEIERYRRPKRPDGGLTLRIQVMALPVCAERNGCRLRPCGFRIVGIELNFVL
jgi:hypothetical protein